MFWFSRLSQIYISWCSGSRQTDLSLFPQNCWPNRSVILKVILWHDKYVNWPHVNNVQWKDFESSFILLSKVYQQVSWKSDNILIVLIVFKFRATSLDDFAFNHMDNEQAITFFQWVEIHCILKLFLLEMVNLVVCQLHWEMW